MKTRIWNRQWAPAILLLGGLLIVGVWSIINYAANEKERDLRAWETLLGVVAESRVQSLNQWIDGQYGVVRELADNASLRFYLSQLVVAPDAESIGSQAAQFGYLRNLLETTAERNGFSLASQKTKIQANIASASDSGIVIVDLTGKTIVGTSGFHVDEVLKATLLKVVKTGQPALQDLYENTGGEVVLGFAIPVFSVQSNEPGQRPIAAIAGVKRARDELFPLLLRKGTLTSADETLLVRREGDSIAFISPLADGTAPLRKQLSLSAGKQVEVEAVTKPGTFSLNMDYAGREVLTVSRSFRQTPWVLVQKIDAVEALKESRDHQRFLMISLTFGILVIAAGLIAAWWHGASVKERSVSEVLRSKSRELADQSALLMSVMDGTPDLIFTVEQERLKFCNKAFGSVVKESPLALRGKTLSSIVGPSVAHQIDSLVQESLRSSQAVSRMLDLEIGCVASHNYFSAVPIPTNEGPGLVLCLARDMTVEQDAQKKRQALMNQLVGVLTCIVDSHDPFCTEHSMRTALVAGAIARELGLDDSAAETLDMAAKLANVGKIFVPRELLTKREILSPEEQKIMQSHVQHSVAVLKAIEFEGPVIDVIGQKSEHLDGSGYPAGLKESELLLESRILAVANAFVAMVSARAYRAGVPLEQTLDKLLSESGSKYDRHVVAALFHVAENRPEWIKWSAPSADAS
ncbi:MAG: HD domain-containing protein [Gammaproteobacteria bacterium]|nr:HD domain-containing protein [Gammaproteobacteria bacterium]MBU2436044.1 HD domain-containing protein [Gammaproteobacteria bacterium]MBU2449986.1 HD domain-containing protein [Gammaproteobacteria bacterium]